MLQLIKMAWHIMWCNWRRTFITAVAIVPNMFLFIVFQAFMEGTKIIMPLAQAQSFSGVGNRFGTT